MGGSTALAVADSISKIRAASSGVSFGFANNYSQQENGNLANSSHPKTNVPFDSEGFPVFESEFKMSLDPSDYLKTRPTHFRRASQDLYEKSVTDKNFASKFTSEELGIFRMGNVPERFTWHHHQDTGIMELVGRTIHTAIGNIGGFSIWGPGK